MVFNFAKQCAICTLQLTARQFKTKQISQFTNSGISTLLNSYTVSVNVELRVRLEMISSSNIEACYHRACWKKLMTKSELQCSQSLTRVGISTPDPSAQACMHSLPVWNVNNCGPMRSHAHYLEAVAREQGMKVLFTRGDGHCFYNSVELCLRELGVAKDIWQLRGITADQLVLDRHIHAPCYQVDVANDEGQVMQAPTFDTYVAGTRTGNEWATEMCVSSLAKALNISIRIVSTVGEDKQLVSAFIRDYVDGVTSDRFITIGFNKASQHYVAFGALPEAMSTPRVRNLMCNGEAMECGGASTTLPHCPVNVVETSVVDTNEHTCVMNNANVVTCVVEAMECDGVATPIPHIPDNVVLDTNEHTCVMNNTNVVTSAELNNETCCNCKRQETDKYHLHLLKCSGSITKRNYSTITTSQIKDTFVLCYHCRVFLNVTPSTDNNMWAHGWPSVITYLLINSDIRAALWSYLPSCYRCSLSDLATNLSLINGAVNDNQFQNYTDDVRLFTTRTQSGDIGDFIQAMDSTCFPCVKCPAGCFAFVDDCVAIPFNHFLAWKFDLIIHKGNSNYFKGARADWPSRSVQLSKFLVNPGMIVNERGLCVLMCATHGKGLFKPIVHVPVNPILKDMGLQYPDTNAAATLQPNVIRKGLMGAWTNSNHVVQAVGGYTGISSSSIALKVDTAIKDERLAMSTCLTMSRRPDIVNVVRNHFSTMSNGDEELKRLWDVYDLIKPSETQISSCLNGGSYVNAFDAFSFNNRTNVRDTEHLSENNVTRATKKVSLPSVMVVLVHPENEYGHSPLKLFDQSKKGESVYAVTRLLGELIVHCPCLHSVLLDTIDVRNTSSYVVKLAQFVKQLEMSSKSNSKPLSKLLTTFGQGTGLELTNRKITTRSPSSTVSCLLASVCAGEVCAQRAYSSITHLHHASDAKVLLLYRFEKSAFRNVIPLHIQNHHLVALFSKDEYVFRWNENLMFWKVVGGEKSYSVSKLQNVTDGRSLTKLAPHWSLAVYVKSVDFDFVDACLTAHIGEQKSIRCSTHGRFLVKQPITCEVICCVKNCAKKSRWRCIADGNTCINGVCLSHGKRYIEDAVVVNVCVDIDDDRFSSLEVADLDDELEIYSDDECNIFLPIGQETAFDCHDLPAHHSRKDMIPIYDVRNRMSGHYLWNQGYGVMSRKNNFGPNVLTNAMLQHIVAVTNNASVSLLYPEGQLFPRIFYASRDNSVIGALPSFMLNSSCSNVSFLAPAAEHYLVRMKDGDLLTSKENIYWHYLFDVNLNTKLQNNSSLLVFKRGFEFLLEKDSLKSGECIKHLSKLPMDEFESVRRVKELASLLKKGPWSYFMTLTVNDTYTPGVRVITQAIKEFADGDVEKHSELTNTFLPFVLRAWERFVRFFLQELIMRNENIVGKVQNMFYRYEFQGAGARGNKPHVHIGITLAPEHTDISTSRICCKSQEFHSSLYGTDYDTLRQLGVVQNEDDYNTWCDVVACVNHHDCSKTQGRCMKATNAEGEKVCRYHRQPPLPLMGDSCAWFTPTHVPYPEEVYMLLEEMGLARKEQPNLHEPEQWVLHEALAAGRWHYRASSDEFFLASIPLVSAITQSSTNVEMCDRHFQVSYLVKYIAGKEEHQLVDVAGSKTITDVNVTTEEHAHEKISNCSRILQQKEKQNAHLGREISLSEVVWFNFGFSYTYCTAEFIHISTLPVENRAAVLLRHKHNKNFVSADDNSIIPIEMRVLAQLPNWRQFTKLQEAHCIEYRNSAYSIDTTSAFNIRPPELFVFDDLQLYHECFTVVKVVKSVVTGDVASQPWIDGASRLVKLRSCSILKAIAFLRCKSADGDAVASILLQSIFVPIEQGSVVSLNLFVHNMNTREVVSVVSAIKPWDRNKFVNHLCLTLGRYDTEFDLYQSGSIKEAFIKAGLLPNAGIVSRDNVLNILRTYVLADLAFQPISARQFSRYLKAALDTLNAVFIEGVLGDYTPCLSEVTLKEQATAQVTQLEQSRRQQLVNGLFDDAALRDQLPADLLNANFNVSSTWVPQIEAVDLLSADSLHEQSIALANCIDAVDRFLDPACRGVRFPCLVGRPGSGKSHVLKLSCAYALSKGLQCEMISWTSHRSRVLGGRHLHLCFPLPVKQGTILLADGIATECLRSLAKDSLKQAVVIRTDVFFFEEIGLLSAEYFCALDSVLRSLMHNSLPWGGKLLISSGDCKQLPPIEGRPIWTSANMCTLMKVIMFKADVRALDPNLRWLNDQCRLSLDSTECAAVANTILDNCSSAVDWDSVPEDAVRIVPTKAAERTVIDTFLATQVTKSYQAFDEVLNGSVWSRANDRITKRLNRECYEYENCRLYLRAIVCMTHNERRQAVQFSQGQLAVVTELPEDGIDFLNQRIKLRLAPPGFNRIDTGNIPNDWPEISVRPRCTASVVVGPSYQMGRRTQFPIRYHMTSTIHRIQGETVSLYATQLCDSTRDYRLWQKEQLAVLISRARYCRDIIFVGARNETFEALKRVLAITSKWHLLVDEYLNALDVMARPIVRQVRLELHPFLPVYRELPTTTCGYVYLIASIPFPNKCFIGQCDDLKRALREHNTGYGSDETRSTTLHPWGVFAFVCGFDDEDVQGGRDRRNTFWFDWQNSIDLALGPEVVYDRGLEIVTDWMRRAPYGLVIVKCGDVRLP